MNLISDFEAHKRDEDFDREDAKRHRETCSPAGNCYVPYVGNVRGEQHYCDIHRPSGFCELCDGTGRVHGKPGPGGVVSTIECSCITQRYEP